MFTTTYQHYFQNPYTYKPPGFSKPVNTCICPEDKPERKCQEPEWTGIAPMGKLIDPRVIPKGAAPKPRTIKCIKTTPKLFLAQMKYLHPDMFKKFRKRQLAGYVPPKEIIEAKLQPGLTTYQIDYLNRPEYADPQLSEINKVKKKRVKKRVNFCEDFKENVKSTLIALDHGEKLPVIHIPNKPGADSESSNKITTMIKTQTDGLKWPPREWKVPPNYSEYMDSISRGGCIIMRNNIHDHRPCKIKRNCNHELNDLCFGTDGRDMSKRKQR